MTINEIKQLNEQAGHHFFSPDTMRFFNSRIGSTVKVKGTLAYFVTSERDYAQPRLYSLRVCNLDNGHMDTIGEFQAYQTRAQAMKAMEEI